MCAQDFRLLTFDCYGTLIDWESGIRSALERLVGALPSRLDPEAMFQAYLRNEAAVQAGPFRSYAQVLQETAVAVGAESGLHDSPRLRRCLLDSLPGWQPFPDTVPALRRLTARYRLGILSNVDHSLLAATLRWLPVSFDLIVTAEDVRSYKPAPGHFRAMLARVGCPPNRVLHVAQSLFHDIAPCQRLGIACAWINRRGERRSADYRPDMQFDDLERVGDRLL